MNGQGSRTVLSSVGVSSVHLSGAAPYYNVQTQRSVYGRVMITTCCRTRRVVLRFLRCDVQLSVFMVPPEPDDVMGSPLSPSGMLICSSAVRETQMREMLRRKKSQY